MESVEPGRSDARSEDATITRREFGSRTAAGLTALALSEVPRFWAGPRSKVVVVSARAPMGPESTPSLELVEKMVETGITELAGRSDPVQAWATFVRPADAVGLPTAGGQLENVPEVNIAVYRALARLGVRRMVVGTHRMSGTWRARVTEAMERNMPELIAGKLFGIAGLPIDSLIVTPTIKHHDIAGISGTLKLYAAFSKKGPWNYHGTEPRSTDHWDGSVGGGMGACGWVPANDFREQRKLHIVDMLRVGTTSRSWTAWPDGWAYTKCLVLSTDPVAADRVAFDIYLKVGRPSGKLDPLYHVERADRVYGAGVSDLRRIDVKRVIV